MRLHHAPLDAVTDISATFVPDMDAKVEFEYVRHGTTCLTGAIDVVSGTVHKPFLRATRTEADFAEFLAGLLGTDNH